MTNAFTIDVEDYFHPSEVSKSVPMDQWSALSSRVEVGTDILLQHLHTHETKATFFILGWVAARKPSLIRRIADAGHEIGCHSHLHRLVYDLNVSEFRRDTLDACKTIADACGFWPRAYRAPSYSIVRENMWALEVLAECGFTHDSSIFPVVHDRYGIPGFRRDAQRIDTPSGPIIEVPVATAALGRAIAPVGGGAYLRLFPYRYTAAGIRRLNFVEHAPACVYVHPWELDSAQPRIARGFVSRLRTYSGLRTVERKIATLLADFSFSTLTHVFPLPAPTSETERYDAVGLH